MKSEPQYLFVCVENACRSQMAQGLFNALTHNATAESAGTSPAGSINPMAIDVMRERGINISLQKSKMLTPELTERAYRVITMGCVDGCPFTPSEKTIKWDIPDPKGKEKQFFVEVRNMIEKQIIQLLKEENLIF